MSNMVTEIVAFIMSMSGWVLISSTILTEDWRWDGSLDDSILESAFFWSNLWKTCVTDSTGVTNCKEFPSMLALDGYIQACRGLIIAAVCLGFFGAVFALVGMKCTKIGGSDQNKARIACFAGVNFILCGVSSLSACSVYAHRITSEFFDPMFVAQKYELGAALFVGWTGSILCILGGVIFCFSIVDIFTSSSHPGYIYRAHASASHVPSQSRGHRQPLSQRPSQEYSRSSRIQHFDKNAYV
ncbi:claudin-10 [Esox lucius]|uniref:Claudin n=1 Tax=Esox lucius TaxID=8010 RepID=A0A3P8XZM3_ESOLU|nr:claudin-10 [Esox lucius]